MRKHGWELPYHPLQVVAIAVFLALAFAFYVFFVPFVGRKLFEYIVIGCFSPLVTSVFGLYIWCAATDPGDPGVFRSKKYGKIPDLTKGSSFKEPLPGSGVSVSDTNTETAGEKLQPEGPSVIASAIKESSSNLEQKKTGWKDLFILICAWFPLTWILNSSCSSKQSSEQHMCEDDILYCSLCEVEVRCKLVQKELAVYFSEADVGFMLLCIEVDGASIVGLKMWSTYLMASVLSDIGTDVYLNCLQIQIH